MSKRTQRLSIAALVLLAASVWAYRSWRQSQASKLPMDPAPTVTQTLGRDAPTAGETRWLKGQLHTHSSNSPDAKTPPGDVIRWYGERGYDFVVMTDHNYVTVPPAHDGVLAIPGVELTQNYATCEPPPEPGMKCLLHVNALFVDPARGMPKWPPEVKGSRAEAYRHAVLTTQELGGLAMLNHPNFHYAADGEVAANLAVNGLSLIEVANEAIDSNNAGDRKHRSTEAIWDDALTRGARIWGVATDDAHHFYDAEKARAAGETVYEGDRGFVMVFAQKTPESIRAALEQGRFYASSGVLLSRNELVGNMIELEVAPQSEGEHEFVFTGASGDLIGLAKGRSARLDLSYVHSKYVRATVTDARGKKAWLQPVFPERSAGL